MRSIRIARRIIPFWLVAIMLISAVSTGVLVYGSQISEPTEKAYNFTQSLSAGSIVIESFDFGPSTRSENYPQAKAHLYHCKQLGLKVVALAFWSSGTPIGMELLQEIYGSNFPDIPEYGTEVVYLGYVPGNEVGMQTFGDNTATAKGIDHYGNEVTSLPLMQQCQSAADFDLWAEWSSGTPGEQQVIQFVQFRHGGPSAVPLIVGATAVSVPGMLIFYPVEILGYMSGTVGAAEYEFLLMLHYAYEPSLIPYVLGVKAGVWIEYGDFLATWRSEDPGASPPQFLVDINNTQWSRNAVQEVSGANITFQITTHYENDTEHIINRQVNAYTGNGNGTFWFVLTCLELGDKIYADSGYTVNETTSGTYASFTREVNHLNIILIQPDHNSSQNLYWDKITGALTEWTIQESLLDNGYITSWSTSFKMVDANLWKTINVPADYSTIQEALDEAVSGDTVRVAPGVYYEHLVICKSLSLLGQSRETTLVDGGGAGTVVKVLASYVTVNGFTIKNGNTGVSISGSSQHTINISRNTMTLNTELAIYFARAKKSTVSDNVISLNGAGIYLALSNSTAILGNQITQSGYYGDSYQSGYYYGLWLSASRNITLRNNRLSDNLYNFAMTGVALPFYTQDIDVSNTIDDKPMLYLLNQHNVDINPSTFPEVGYLAIINSTNIHVEDTHLTRNVQAFLIAYTNSSTISNVTLSHNEVGIRLEGSCHNIISNSTLQENSLGIWARSYSERNNITSNRFINNDSGVSIQWSNENRLLDNVIEDNRWEGVSINSNSTIISRNIIVNNTQGGILVHWCSGNLISDNTIANNGWYSFDSWEPIMGGLSLWGASDNTIIQNSIFDNRYGIITQESSTNAIYHNNFTGNRQHVYNPYNYWTGYYSSNIWDNGYPSGGNYWSNYTGTDNYSGPGQNIPGSDFIGDTPHIIDLFNVDYYPLMILYEAPTAGFTHSPLNPYVGETVSFDASASYDPDGTIVSYRWNFGDDNITTTSNPMIGHTYAEAGTLDVNLIVTDNDGLTDTLTKSITIGKFSSTISISASLTTITLGERTSISGSITPTRVGAIVAISYRFSGDVTWSILTTVATDQNSQYAYDWVPSEIGTYELKASWQGDETTLEAESSTTSVTVLADTTPPIASFTCTPTEPNVNEAVTFDASASNDNIGIVLYEWNFGDETTATGMIVTHAYSEAGTYNVGLTVWDAAGNHGSTSATIMVTKMLSVKLSGEFDYLRMEPVKLRLAALVADAETMETVSGALVTVEIYDPAGNLWVSAQMQEKIGGSGIYEWTSAGTISQLKLSKGIYLVRVGASFHDGPTTYDISLFHIDPPAEDTASTMSPLFYAVTILIAAGIIIAIALLKQHKRPQLNNQ